MQHCETNNLTEGPNSYRHILKATTLFGGVQVFQVLISIIRSKFIAVLLGPEGMGIAGLLTSTTSLISGITNFGLGTSAIRNVAEANGSGNLKKDFNSCNSSSKTCMDYRKSRDDGYHCSGTMVK